MKKISRLRERSVINNQSSPIHNSTLQNFPSSHLDRMSPQYSDQHQRYGRSTNVPLASTEPSSIPHPNYQNFRSDNIQHEPSSTYPYPTNQYQNHPRPPHSTFQSDVPTGQCNSCNLRVSSTTPSTIPPNYPSYTNQHQSPRNLVPSTPTRSTSTITASPAYSVHYNTSTPSVFVENRPQPSPLPTHFLQQPISANHSILSSPAHIPINNNPPCAIHTVPPTNQDVPLILVPLQFYYYPTIGNHSYVHGVITQNSSQVPHSIVTPSSADPGHLESIPDDVIYGEKLLTHDVVQQAKTRIHSARVALGETATTDARKGLSRRIQTGNQIDINLFGDQLKNSRRDACEPYYENITDKVLCIAVSYVHSEHPIGRFKFSPGQWNSLKVALANLCYCGVTEVRLWLDQCLWIRDVNQESWAHTGLIPYVIYPVVSLEVKRFQHDRTTASYRRMWPFVEELAGLWSMGLMITKEMRSENAESGSRSELSYNLRHRLEPEKSMELILMNIYHGAADGHETGWKEDVEELKEMARLNISSEIERIAIGSDWRSKIARAKPKSQYDILSELRLSHCNENHRAMNNHREDMNIYLEGSRRIKKRDDEGWDGFIEFTSGNGIMTHVSDFDRSTMNRELKKYNILTFKSDDKYEFQILGKGDNSKGIWLLVAMDGPSSGFSRGRVDWTKIIHGENSCYLFEALEEKIKWVLENVLREQTNEVFHVTKIECVDNLPIEWT